MTRESQSSFVAHRKVPHNGISGPITKLRKYVTCKAVTSNFLSLVVCIVSEISLRFFESCKSLLDRYLQQTSKLIPNLVAASDDQFRSPNAD